MRSLVGSAIMTHLSDQDDIPNEGEKASLLDSELDLTDLEHGDAGRKEWSQRRHQHGRRFPNAGLYASAMMFGYILFGSAFWLGSVWNTRGLNVVTVDSATNLLDDGPVGSTTNLLNDSPADAASTLLDDSALEEAHTNTIEISKECQETGITPVILAKSRVHLGNTDRWHQVMKKEGHIKVAALGGSVTAGHTCSPPKQHNVPNFTCAWPHRLETMFGLSLPQYQANQTIEAVNFGRGGTSSVTGSTNVMQLTDFDVIIFHWTANDDGTLRDHVDDPSPYWAAFETDIRSALALPQQPAVIILEGLGLKLMEPFAEEMHYSVARAYDIPVISARAAFWHHHLYGENARRPKIHVKAHWHARYACLLYENWIQESHSDFEMSDYDYEVDIPPVFGGTTRMCNATYEASAHTKTLEHSPTHVDGWSYFADVPEKFGYITTTENSVLQFELFPKEGKNNTLILHYLESYPEEWGSVLVSFSNGHNSLEVNARKRRNKYSQTAEASFDLQSNEPFNVTITSLSGKFKLLELFLFSCQQQS